MECRGIVSSWLIWLRNAFDLAPATPRPTAEQLALVERVCAEVTRRQMTVPALILLESLRPMNHLGAQALYFFEPFLAWLGGQAAIEDFAKFLDRPDAADILCEQLERRAAERELRP